MRRQPKRPLTGLGAILSIQPQQGAQGKERHEKQGHEESPQRNGGVLAKVGDGPQAGPQIEGFLQ